jgi:hypothetical protein
MTTTQHTAGPWNADKWIQGFVAEINNWADAREFIDNGGVPGCRVPEGVSFHELAEWWLQPVTDGTYMDAVHGRVGDDPRAEIPNPLALLPKYAVEILMDADDSYSPDD